VKKGEAVCREPVSRQACVTRCKKAWEYHQKALNFKKGPTPSKCSITHATIPSAQSIHERAALVSASYGCTAHKYCNSASRDLTLPPLHYNHNASLKYGKGEGYSPHLWHYSRACFLVVYSKSYQVLKSLVAFRPLSVLTILMGCTSVQYRFYSKCTGRRAGCHAAAVYGSGLVRSVTLQEDDEQATVSQKWLRWSVLKLFLRDIGRNRFCK
jgi:hypothetical protein